MTRILCFSDLHCGAGTLHRRDALADQAAILDQIVAVAVERGVDLCLDSGDTFHRAKPSPAELHVYRRFARQLADAGIPMVAIGGNGWHSVVSGEKSALELFDSPLLRVSRSPELIEIAGVSVATLPPVSVARLVAAQGGGDRGEINEQAIDLLLATARNLYAEADPDKPCVLLAHWMVSGAMLPNGLPVDSLGLVLPLGELQAIGFDAIVLGDIHKAQVLSSFGPFVMTPAFYCGSPMTLDFGEQDTRHGCAILEFQDGQPGCVFDPITLRDRRFVTVDVDLTSVEGEGSDQVTLGQVERSPSAIEETNETPETRAESSPHPPHSDPSADLDETDLIAAAITEHLPLTDAVLRIRVTATEEQWRRVEVDRLLEFCDDAGAHRVFGGIQWLPVRAVRARVAGFTEALAPDEAVGLWAASQELDQAEADSLAELTGALLGAN